jgi:hypothetical protein
MLAGAGVLLVFWLAGCASISEEQCRSGDWYGIGWLDGSRGLPPDRLASHQKACGEYGLSVDGEAYRKGREAGLQVFCTPENGLAQGKSGQAFRPVCPGSSSRAYQRAFELGHEIWMVQKSITELEKKREDLEAVILDDSQPKDVRKDALEELRRIEDDLRRAKVRLRQLQARAAKVSSKSRDR